MTILDERDTTQVQTPRVEPIIEEEILPERPLPEEPRRRTQLVRWLGWMTGLFLISLAVVFTAWMIPGEETAEAPLAETSLTSAVITEAARDAAYAGPAQLPGGVLPETLAPIYDAPAQLPGGVLPANLAPTFTVSSGAVIPAPQYTAPAQLPGGVLPANLESAYAFAQLRDVPIYSYGY